MLQNCRAEDLYGWRWLLVTGILCPLVWLGICTVAVFYFYGALCIVQEADDHNRLVRFYATTHRFHRRVDCVGICAYLPLKY